MLKSLKRVLSGLSLSLIMVGCSLGGPSNPQSTTTTASSTNMKPSTAASKAGLLSAYYTGTSPNLGVVVNFTPPSGTTSAIPFPGTFNAVADSSPLIGMDDNGNILLAILEDTQVLTYYYDPSQPSPAWVQVTVPTQPPSPFTDPDFALSVNPSGLGLLVLTAGSHVKGYLFNKSGPSWTQILQDTEIVISQPQAVLNAGGEGATGYFDSSYTDAYIRVYNFNSGSPDINTTVYTGAVNIQTLILPSATPTAMTIFTDTSNNLNWSLLTASGPTSPAVFATDVNIFTATVDPKSGNVLASYNTTTAPTTLQTQVFTVSNSTWSGSNVLSTNFDPQVVSAATSGEGGVAWTSGGGTQVEVAGFEQLGQGSNSPTATLTYTVPGGGLSPGSLSAAAATNPSGSVFSAGILAGTTLSGTVYYSQVGLSPGNTNSPTNFRAKKIKDKFLTQTDLIASLTWAAPIDGTPVSYIIFKNGVEIANVPANQLSYKVHGLKYNRNYTFGVSAVSSNGTISTPATANLIFKKK